MKKTQRPGPLLLYGLGVVALILAGVYAAGYAGDWVRSHSHVDPPPTPAASGGQDWLNEARNSSAHASWAYSFSDLSSMEESVDAIVLAEVEDVRPGRVSGSEVSQVSFTNAHLRVLEDWSRQPLSSDEVVVEQTGGDGTPFILEDPPYKLGEVYVLFLTQQSVEPFLYITGNPPQARYLMRNQRLQAMPVRHPGRLTRGWDGQTVQDLRQAVYDNRSVGP